MDNVASPDPEYIEALLDELSGPEKDGILRDAGVNPGMLTDNEVDELLYDIIEGVVLQEASAGEKDEPILTARPGFDTRSPRGAADFEHIASLYVQTSPRVRPRITPAVSHPDAVLFMMIIGEELHGYATGARKSPPKQLYVLADDIHDRLQRMAAVEVSLFTRFASEDRIARPPRVSWEPWTNSVILGTKNKDAVYAIPARQLSRGDIEYILIRLVRAVVGHYHDAIAFMGAFVALAGEEQWAPMRAGEKNCLVAAIKPYLKCRKPRRGHKDPIELLEKFGEEHQASGVEYDDLPNLAISLELHLVFRDWNGDMLYETAAGRRYHERTGHSFKTIELVRHNGHCQDLAEFPSFPPIASRVLVAPREVSADEILGDLMTARESPARETPAVQFGPHPDCHVKASHYALRALRESGIEPGTRLWVVRDEAIASDGRICRPDQLTKELAAAEAEERRIARDPDHGPVSERPAELTIGGVQAYRFQFWAERNRLRPVADRLVDDMKAAQVESPAWNAKDRYDAAGCYELDLRAAYLGCEDPEFGRADSACASYLQKYRMPHADSGMHWYAATSLEQVRDLAGSFVRLSAWELRGHGYVLSVIGRHLRTSGGILPTPLAIALQDLGYLAGHTLSAVAVSFEAAPLLEFLDATASRENKHLSQRFIGRCSMTPRRSTIFTDRAEATHYFNRFLREARLPLMADIGDGMWAVSYNEGHAQYPHVRAYVLAYMHISVLLKLKDHPDAVRIATDSLTIPGKADAQPNPDAVKYGVWRVKTAPRAWEEHRVMEEFPKGEAPPAEGLPELPGLGIASSPLTYLDGQGGAGKTVAAIRALSGRTVTVLGKDHIGVLDLESKVQEAREAGFNMAGFTAATYHSFWHLGYSSDECEKRPACGACLACVGWSSELMGKARRGAGLPEFVIWDEVGFIPAKHFRPILEYCRARAVRVICAADLLGQIRQFNDRDPGEPANHQILLELGARVIEIKGDMRARDPLLRELKGRIWRTDDDTQITETAATLRSRGQSGKLADLLKIWTPMDIFAVSTRVQGRQIESALLAEHARRFPGEKVPMRLKLTKEQAQALRKGDGPGQVEVPGELETRTVPAIVGTRVWVDLETAQRHLRGRTHVWVYDGLRTLHSLQGLTIEAPSRLFILAQGLDGDWNRNACYTAVSRVRELGQLYWVTSY